MTSHRLVRQGNGGVAVAAAIGLASVLTHQNVPLLVAPARCSAGSELLAISLARLRPAVPPFSISTSVDTWVLSASLAVLVWLVWRLTDRLLIAAIVGVAIVASPETTTYLRPLSTVALPIAVAWCCLWLPGRWQGSARARLAASWSLLVLTPVVWPSLTLPAVAVWLAIVTWGTPKAERPRGVTVAGGAAAIVIATALVVRIGPSPATLMCLSPAIEPAWWRAAASRVTAPVLAAGPYVGALAALGVFSRVERRTRAGFALAASLVLLVTLVGEDFVSPLPVLLWLAAAQGLVEVVRVCRPGPGGRLAGVTLVLLVPALQWQARTLGPPAAVEPDYGHARLSLNGLTRLLEALPPGANLVTEDASIDVMVRAMWASPPTMVPANPVDVTARLMSGHRVFALPRAQAALQDLGIRIEDTSAAGLAELFAGGECRALNSDWRAVQDVVRAAPVFALAARDAAEAGPVVVYASFVAPPALDPVAWPPPARRGFYTTTYDQTVAAERDHLDRDIADDHLPLDQFTRTDRYVARLELWRTPSAPLRLTVGLGQRPTQFIGHVIAQREPKRLTLCPAFPHNVKGLNP